MNNLNRAQRKKKNITFFFCEGNRNFSRSISLLRVGSSMFFSFRFSPKTRVWDSTWGWKKKVIHSNVEDLNVNISYFTSKLRVLYYFFRKIFSAIFMSALTELFWQGFQIRKIEKNSFGWKGWLLILSWRCFTLIWFNSLLSCFNSHFCWFH